MTEPNTITTAEPQINSLWNPDYTALDYNPLRDEVKDYIQTRYESEGIQDDFLQSAGAMVFIDAASYIGKLIGQRAEDLTGEVWMPSVQLRENLLKLVNLLGQQPILPRAARVNIEVLAKSIPQSTITLPRLYSMPITGLDGKRYNFEVMAEENDYYTRVILPAGIRQSTLTFYAGTTYHEYFQSTGAFRQSYSISRYPVIEGSVLVSVHPKPPELITPDEIVASRIAEVPSLVTPLDQLVYKRQVTENNGVILKFAIDQFGKVPPKGWYVYIDYRIGGGSSTNCTVGSLNQTYQLTDDNANPILLQFTNRTSRGIGGANEETIEQIKERVPGHVRSTDRLSQREDYITILKSELPEEIDDVFVLDYETDRRLGGGTATHVPQNTVFLWILPKSGQELDDDQRQIIASILEDKNLIAIEHYLFSADFYDWDLRAKVYYNKRTLASDLQQKITAALLKEYGATDINGEQTENLRFMRVIRRSKVLSIIQQEIGDYGYVEMFEPASDIDPYIQSPPAFGQVPRLDIDNIVLEMNMIQGDE